MDFGNIEVHGSIIVGVELYLLLLLCDKIDMLSEVLIQF